MAVADARVFTQDLTILDDKHDLLEKLLPRLAEWCIRFSPIVAVDMPDGLHRIEKGFRRRRKT